jgi:orotate phosphoribosyltransferase
MNAATAADLERELGARGALLEGHFRLSSGRHSNRFVQKFRLLEDPRLVERVARALAAEARPLAPSVVVSAAVGGIVLGYETARQLGTFAIFVEKEDGRPALRRGFALGPGDRAFVVEDVVTTGGSIREVIDVVREAGAQIAGVGIVVRRAPVDFGVPTSGAARSPDRVVRAGRAARSARRVSRSTEPGSRFLGAKESRS